MKEEVKNCFRVLGQFEDEDTMAEEDDIATAAEGLGTDQSNSENLFGVFVGPAAECEFFRLQRDFYQQYHMHKELSQYVGETEFYLPNNSY